MTIASTISTTEAAEAGMHGSPTLLVDGVDPFAAPGQPPSLSCRLYRDAAGRADGAPPVDALRRVLEQRLQESFQRRRAARHAFAQRLAAAPPHHHDREYERTECEREPAAVQHLVHRRREKDDVDHHEECGREQAQPERIVPPVTQHEEREQRRDEHRAHHRDAVSRCEPCRAAEADDRDEDGNQQDPIHRWHIDLPNRARRRVPDRHARPRLRNQVFEKGAFGFVCNACPGGAGRRRGKLRRNCRHVAPT